MVHWVTFHSLDQSFMCVGRLLPRNETHYLILASALLFNWFVKVSGQSPFVTSYRRQPPYRSVSQARDYTASQVQGSIEHQGQRGAEVNDLAVNRGLNTLRSSSFKGSEWCDGAPLECGMKNEDLKMGVTRDPILSQGTLLSYFQPVC